jgi:polysaccharide biosynthesis/export protein
MQRMMTSLAAVLVLCLTGNLGASAQAPSRSGTPQPGGSAVPATNLTTTPVAQLPADYVIGSDDLLSIVFWKDRDLSAEVLVRPDGRISLPLLNDVQAAGLTPEQLKERLEAAAGAYIEDPTATVVVREIKSRKVFITGQIFKPGSYSLTTPTTVLQLIAVAGGLQEYADASHILILRPEGGRSRMLRFNYKDASKGKNLQQNVELKPGDTVIVP